MEENEILEEVQETVQEGVEAPEQEEVQPSEKVEKTTEEPPEKRYTQEEVDDMMGKRLARQEKKLRREYDRKYGSLENVLRAGTGKETVEEMTDTFREFYGSRGVQLQEKPQYSDKDIEVLARADAEEIIRGGYEEVAEEVDRLAEVGIKNMTPREKLIFTALAEHRRNADRNRELASLGIGEDVYGSREFAEFAGKFNPNTPIRDIYDIYEKLQPKKEIRTMGSMKHGQGKEAKDHYTPEEIERLTEEDLDDPKVWEAVRRSMTGG